MSNLLAKAGTVREPLLQIPADSTTVSQISTSQPSTSTRSVQATALPATLTATTKQKLPLNWKKSCEIPYEIPSWRSQLPPETSVETPVQYFRKLFDSDLLTYIVEQTNLYATQTDVASNFHIDTNELEQFIGIILYMSLISVPGTRRYWNSKCGIPQVSNVMPLRRWEQIKRYIHFADNSMLPIEPPDRIFKIRKLVEGIRKNLNIIPLEQHLSVDEQIVPFKGRSGLKQYNPKKPKKWGYKLFCMAGASGIVYDFEIYTGSMEQPSHLPNISISSNVVLRLAQIIPENQNFLLFYDNWFCSAELQVALAKKGIYSLGTVQPNRVPNNGMPSDSTLKKLGRGAYVERIAEHQGVVLKMVKWLDTRFVNLLSTFIGALPETKIKRFDRKSKVNIEVKCPSIIHVYNKFMGGVDLIDSLLALYRIRIRSKKYYMRIFFHLLDMCIVIAWLLYRRASDDCGIKSNKQMSLFDFKMDVAESLCWAGKQQKRGRSSTTPISKRSKRNGAPNVDCRYDKIDHWPNYVPKTGRCKYSENDKKCQKITKVKCTKCESYLCFVPDRNCFSMYHNP